ncbi:MAG: hypothetical protein FWB91_07040 [Defluviitaleaceae bacterium]|nr:hypothetical protein [Defluviitaleaceae bacterium]
MRLAAVQVAIFFILGAATLTLTLWERHVWERSGELSQRLTAFEPGPAEVAARVRAERDAADYLDSFLAGITAVPFGGEWLPYILDTVPADARLTGLDYRDGELLLTGEVTGIAIAETHRTNLTELFEYVRLGRISFSDGLYRYELWARP